MAPDELIEVLERAARLGIDPRRVLLALGFRPAARRAAPHDRGSRGQEIEIAPAGLEGVKPFVRG